MRDAQKEANVARARRRGASPIGRDARPIRKRARPIGDDVSPTDRAALQKLEDAFPIRRASLSNERSKFLKQPGDIRKAKDDCPTSPPPPTLENRRDQRDQVHPSPDGRAQPADSVPALIVSSDGRRALST